jgi:hypothetical protein
MILKDIMQAGSPRTTRIGSDSSIISQDAMEHPSITTTEAGQGSLHNKVF